MASGRERLTESLESYYRGCGWRTERADDGTVRAAGLGGVTWIGLPVTDEDVASPVFGARLLALREQRMPGGQLCPLELLPSETCAPALRSLLARLRLDAR